MADTETESKGRVLIIDDEVDFAHYLRNVAVLEGYEARLVRTMPEFEDALDDFDPTTVIMDMVMPETDGFEILRLLGARRSPARILIISGYTPLYLGCAVKMAQGLGLGKTTTLQKPVKLKELRAALAEGPGPSLTAPCQPAPCQPSPQPANRAGDPRSAGSGSSSPDFRARRL